MVGHRYRPVSALEDNSDVIHINTMAFNLLCLRSNKVKNIFLVLQPGHFFLNHFNFFKNKFISGLLLYVQEQELWSDFYTIYIQVCMNNTLHNSR